MTPAIDTVQSVWTAQRWRQHPLRMTGIVLHLILRGLFGLFWIAAGVNKLRKDWLTTDILKLIFEDRLTEMHPDSLQVMFLQDFAIPFYKLVAVFVTCQRTLRGCCAAAGPDHALGRSHRTRQSAGFLGRRLLRRFADPVLCALHHHDELAFGTLAGARPPAVTQVSGLTLVLSSR